MSPKKFQRLNFRRMKLTRQKHLAPDSWTINHQQALEAAEKACEAGMSVGFEETKPG